MPGKVSKHNAKHLHPEGYKYFTDVQLTAIDKVDPHLIGDVIMDSDLDTLDILPDKTFEYIKADHLNKALDIISKTPESDPKFNNIMDMVYHEKMSNIPTSTWQDIDVNKITKNNFETIPNEAYAHLTDAHFEKINSLDKYLIGDVIMDSDPETLSDLPNKAFEYIKADHIDIALDAVNDLNPNDSKDSQTLNIIGNMMRHNKVQHIPADSWTGIDPDNITAKSAGFIHPAADRHLELTPAQRDLISAHRNDQLFQGATQPDNVNTEAPPNTESSPTSSSEPNSAPVTGGGYISNTIEEESSYDD